MKRIFFIIICSSCMLLVRQSFVYPQDPPHTNFRARYNGACISNTGAACHIVNQGKFLPVSYTADPSVDYTNFCLSCHNPAAEAHQRNPGTPSSNSYVNQTGINTSGMKGNSHAWGRPIGNAGTRIPVEANFAGTTYMPGSIPTVLCQTCHDGMDKGTGNSIPPIEREQNVYWATGLPVPGSNYTKYRLIGYTSTMKYLQQYIRVYRNAGGPIAAPVYERSKRQYMVNYTTYSYNNLSATVTFHAPQPAGAGIYVDIPEPYLRQSDNMNANCYDCHADRLDQMATHAPGGGAKNSHPVSVQLKMTFGLHSTLMPATKGNAFLETGNTVVCTSCHQQHNSVSADGELQCETDSNQLCSDCHKTKLYGYSSAGSVNYHNGPKHTSPTVCLDCHTTHNSRNILLIKNVINGVLINFQNFSGAQSFGNDTGSSICEVCHTTTTYHLSDGSGTGHLTGKNCTSCHLHSTGFQPSGCNTCHGFPPSVSPGPAGPIAYGWSDTTGNLHAVHMTYIQNNFGLTGNSACARCHGNPMPPSDHFSGLTLSTAIIDTSSWGGGTFSDGGTPGKSNTGDDTCTNVSCHKLPQYTRVWGATPGQCNNCHEYPGSSRDWSGPNGHLIRYDAPVVKTHLTASGFIAATDNYSTVTSDPTKCGKCHSGGVHQNGHIVLNGSDNANCGMNFTFTVITSGAKVTCSDVYCHNGKTTPTWYGTIICGQCHGAVTKSQPYEAKALPTGSEKCDNTGRGLHGVHANYSSASYGMNAYGSRGNCLYCHTSGGDGSPSATHINGLVNITGNQSTGRQSFNSTGLGYNFATKTCTNACHRNRGATATWGSYTSSNVSLACNNCHDDASNKATVALSGAHGAHLNATINISFAVNTSTGGGLMGAAGNTGCQDCHPNNIDDQWSQGKADDGTKKAYPHAKDGTNVVPDNAVINSSVLGSGIQSGTNTNCTGSCHPRSKYIQWGGKMDCNSCHYYPVTGLPYYKNNTGVGYLSGDASTFRHNFHFGASITGTQLTCDNCHKVPANIGHAKALPVSPANVFISHTGVTFIPGNGCITPFRYPAAAGCHDSWLWQ